MARRKKDQPDPHAIYVAVDSFAGQGFSVARGARVKGDNPVVTRCFPMFAEDGTADDELDRRRAALYTAELKRAEPIEFTRPDSRPRLRDEDAVVAIRDAGRIGLGQRTAGKDGRSLSVAAGTRVARDHPAVKAAPKAFVPVIPDGIDRERALVARATMRHYDEAATRVERVVYEGTWVDRADPLVAIHPLLFELPPLHVD